MACAPIIHSIMMMAVVAVTVSMMAGAVHAVAHSSAVMAGAYWQEHLEGARMPSTLRAMLSPLDSQHAAELRSQIVQHPEFLPAHASEFCKSAGIQCKRSTYAQMSWIIYAAGVGRTSNVDVDQRRSRPGSFFRQQLTLVAGAKIQVKADMTKTEDEQRAFLPRELAQLFPITGRNVKDVASTLASKLAIPKSAIPSMEDTLTYCDQTVQGVRGEMKACATSIEDLADFAVSTILPSTSTSSHFPHADHMISVLDASYKTPRISADTTHTVLAIKTLKQDPNDKYLACHDMNFPFRIFYCHYLDQTRVFLATIQAQDGSLYNRVALCHYDTSAWDPHHFAFSDLHTKPGQSEACHWLSKSGIVFLHHELTHVLNLVSI